MRIPLRDRDKHVVLLTLCLMMAFSLPAKTSEEPAHRKPLQALSTQTSEPRQTGVNHSQSSIIVLTVSVVSAGVAARLYDEEGSLIGTTPPLTPPAVASLRTSGGSLIELDLPSGVFSGPTIIDIYLKGRLEVRPLIQEADRKAMGKSTLPLGEIGAVEFVSQARPTGTVTISLSYPSDSSPALLNSLRACYLERNSVAWLPVRGSRLNAAERTVAFDVSDFEVFRLMVSSAPDLRGVIVYPNPFRPDLAKDNVLKFIGLTDNVSIKIYTLSGELVWTKQVGYTAGGTTWDGRNLDGKTVSSGLYVYQITNAKGEKVEGRISVIW